MRSGNGQVRSGEAAGHNTCTQAAPSLSLLTTTASSLLQLWDHSVYSPWSRVSLYSVVASPPCVILLCHWKLCWWKPNGRGGDLTMFLTTWNLQQKAQTSEQSSLNTCHSQDMVGHEQSRATATPTPESVGNASSATRIARKLNAQEDAGLITWYPGNQLHPRPCSRLFERSIYWTSTYEGHHYKLQVDRAKNGTVNYTQAQKGPTISWKDRSPM